MSHVLQHVDNETAFIPVSRGKTSAADDISSIHYMESHVFGD